MWETSSAEIFDGADIDIRILNSTTGLVEFAYCYDNGQRISIAPVPFGSATAHVMTTCATLVINENFWAEAEVFGGGRIPGTSSEEKSGVWVPLVWGGEARGLVCITDYQRENAFSESDVRLLETLAGAMSSALQNARQFAETQRLLNETEQRAAELAVINSIQQGMAAELEFQAIVDLVGGKIREVLHTDEIGIRWYDEPANLVHYLYEFEHGARLEIPSTPPRRAWADLRAGPDTVDHQQRRRSRGFGYSASAGHRPIKVDGQRADHRQRQGARFDHRRGLRARVCLRRVGSSSAADRGGKHGRGAGERPPVRRDPAIVQGERAARRRVGGDQRRAAGAGQPS